MTCSLAMIRNRSLRFLKYPDRSQLSPQSRHLACEFCNRRAYNTMSLRPGPELLSIAPELVQQVIRQVGDRRDLSNARLACKTLDKHASKELFKEVFVSPLEEHFRSWNNISQDDVIRYLPRHATIQTQPDVEDHGMGTYREREEIGDGFKSALAALSKFPNLNSVQIDFTPECAGRAQNYVEVTENVSQRVDMLTLIFRAIRDRAADKTNRTIRKLTVTNLQNCPIPEFTSSELFRDVMRGLEELHISMTQEFNEHRPDHDYTRIELRTFPAHLCLDWLKPISANLKALSIYHSTDNWGPFPGYFDPSGISFPKLETLALGYYTLAHDNDLDWVLAIKSLCRLMLHNCMILSWIRIDSDNMKEWNIRTDSWTTLPDELRDPDDTWCDDFIYGGKWSQCLDRIAGALPNLVDFRFDQGSSYHYRGEPQYGVGHRDSCAVRIFPQRYVSFDNGILPSHWQEADSNGNIESWLVDGFPSNIHAESLAADQRSLDALLHTLRGRS